jgi:ribosomal protein L17
MTKKEVKILRDLQGFIEFCINGNHDFHYVLGNLGHDVNKLFDNAPTFTPRSSGYARFLKNSLDKFLEEEE